MRFFRMFVDLTVQGTGFSALCSAAGDPLPPGVLWTGLPYTGDLPLRTRVTRLGARVDGTMLPAMPIVTAPLAATLQAVVGTDAELIDVAVDGAPELRFGINVLRLCDCVDEDRSLIQRAPPDADVDVAPGAYYMLSRIHVRADAVPGYRIFRLSRWPVAIVVSEHVRDAVVRSGASGLAFSQV
jgi:hypothetical protein